MHDLIQLHTLAKKSSLQASAQVLLDKGVDEGRVLFLSLIAAPEGIHRVCHAYPRVKLIVSEIDDGIGENFQVVPGIGEFGNRYFCE